MCRTKPKKRRLTLVLFTLNTNLLWVKNENFLFRIPFNWAEKELIIKRKDRNLQFLAKQACLRSVYVTSRQFYGLLQWNRFYFQFDFYYVLGVGTTPQFKCLFSKQSSMMRLWRNFSKFAKHQYCSKDQIYWGGSALGQT